jgi:hypothetical protein
MKRGRNICNTLKVIIAGMSLGLMAFCVTSCNGQSRDVNHVPSSVTEYLEQGYTPYLAFDEWSMKGGVMLWEVADSYDERIVLLKDEDSLVHVVRKDHLSQVLTYYKKDWGWYNQVVIEGENSYVYDRYVLEDTVVELKLETRSNGQVFKTMYIKTHDKCIVAKLDDSCAWSGDELPGWHDMKARRSTVFEICRGKKACYYLPSSFWDNPEYYYEYPASDTTSFSFSRFLGLGNGTLILCKETGPILEYKRDSDGIFNSVEVKPHCLEGNHALANYIYRHSGPKIRKKIQNGGITIGLCISDTGKIMKCELVDESSYKDKLEKQICDAIPFKFEPATIYGHPVSCWCALHIGPNDVGYHRADQKEYITVTRTLKESEFRFDVEKNKKERGYVYL